MNNIKQNIKKEGLSKDFERFIKFLYKNRN